MSGKSSGKKRNRAAQSQQHGYQEQPPDHSAKPGIGEAGGARIEKNPIKQRLFDKLRNLELRRRQQEEEKEKEGGR